MPIHFCPSPECAAANHQWTPIVSVKRWDPVFYDVYDDNGRPITLTKTQPEDPAYALLLDGHTSTPTVFRDYCYICRDPEFAQMGLPLCQFCSECKTGHVAADDTICDDCGADAYDLYMQSLGSDDDDVRS